MIAVIHVLSQTPLSPPVGLESPSNCTTQAVHKLVERSSRPALHTACRILPHPCTCELCCITCERAAYVLILHIFLGRAWLNPPTGLTTLAG